MSHATESNRVNVLHAFDCQYRFIFRGLVMLLLDRGQLELKLANFGCFFPPLDNHAAFDLGSVSPENLRQGRTQFRLRKLVDATCKIAAMIDSRIYPCLLQRMICERSIALPPKLDFLRPLPFVIKLASFLPKTIHRDSACGS